MNIKNLFKKDEWVLVAIFDYTYSYRVTYYKTKTLESKTGHRITKCYESLKGKRKIQNIDEEHYNLNLSLLKDYHYVEDWKSGIDNHFNFPSYKDIKSGVPLITKQYVPKDD